MHLNEITVVQSVLITLMSFDMKKRVWKINLAKTLRIVVRVHHRENKSKRKKLNEVNFF